MTEERKIIMKKLFITLIGVLTIGATLPAVAGGDVQSDLLWNREQARRAKLAQIAKGGGAPDTSTPRSRIDKYAAVGHGCPQ